MIRHDHIAYRTLNREKTTKLLCKLFDYKIQSEFDLKFDDGSSCACYALEPRQYHYNQTKIIHSQYIDHYLQDMKVGNFKSEVEYWKPPELFVSQGEPGSIVYNWLKDKNIEAGIHHIALEVPSVLEMMNWWKGQGFVGFSTEEPIYCPEEGLTQIFTKEIPELGHIYEFIERKGLGFCSDSVKKLMEGSK